MRPHKSDIKWIFNVCKWTFMILAPGHEQNHGCQICSCCSEQTQSWDWHVGPMKGEEYRCRPGAATNTFHFLNISQREVFVFWFGKSRRPADLTWSFRNLLDCVWLLCQWHILFSCPVLFPSSFMCSSLCFMTQQVLPVGRWQWNLVQPINNKKMSSLLLSYEIMLTFSY